VPRLLPNSIRYGELFFIVLVPIDFYRMADVTCRPPIGSNRLVSILFPRAIFGCERAMGGQRRNRYDEAFKKRAVERHLKTQTTLAVSAALFGITPGMLSKWVERYSRVSDCPAGKAMNYDAEINRLKSEMQDLKKIVGKVILQKFSDESIAEKIADEPERFFSNDGSADRIH